MSALTPIVSKMRVTDVTNINSYEMSDNQSLLCDIGVILNPNVVEGDKFCQIQAKENIDDSQLDFSLPSINQSQNPLNQAFELD